MMRAVLILILLIGPVCAEEVVVSGLVPLPLVSGVNRVDRLAPDGRGGLVILAWRDNGNAWGRDVFTVMLPDRRNGWSLVGIERLGETPQFSDTIVDVLHTGEDVIRAVRFARASVNGRPSIVLLEATREVSDDLFTATRTNFDVFAITSGDVGTTSEYFTRVKHIILRERFCNAEMALTRASGLPLRSSYLGKKSPDGC